MEDRDVHVADDQLATLCFHLSVLPHTVSGVIFEHVDLQEGRLRVSLTKPEVSIPASYKIPI